MMDYDENRYLHKKWEQKWLKINNKGGWNKDVLGGKESKNQQPGGGTIIRDSRVSTPIGKPFLVCIYLFCSLPIKP